MTSWRPNDSSFNCGALWPVLKITRGVLRILSYKGDSMQGAKIKTRQNPKKSLDQIINPKKSHAKFPSLKNFK